MLDYCSVIEPMMQQHAVAGGGGASTWGMNYNTFSLGINILMFFVVLLVSPQSFVVFRRRKKIQTLEHSMQIHLSRMLRLTRGKAGTSRGGTGNLSPHNPKSRDDKLRWDFFFRLAGASLRCVPDSAIHYALAKTHVSPRGFPGERFTNHSPLVSANKADSFEIGSAGILRPTPFTLSPEA